MATQEMVVPRSETNAFSFSPRLRDAGGTPMKMARALGWFSIGLGVAEVAAPRALAKVIGTRGRRTTTMRLFGLREIAAGIGLLSTRRPGPWLWARVAGDVADLSSLAIAAGSARSRARVSTAIGAVAGVAVLDTLSARQFSSGSSTTHFTASVAINRSPEDCYKYWRDIAKLPTFIEHLKSVRVTGGNRSHWVSQSPLGDNLEWDAEITEDSVNECIAWRSVEGTGFRNWGRVRFEAAPGGRGTIVRLLMNYDPDSHAAGRLWTAVLGADPGMRVRRDLQRFKQILETGEIATTEGQSSGRRSGANWFDRTLRV